MSVKERFVTNKKLIEKYDDKFKNEFYVPQEEINTLDLESVNTKVYSNAEVDLGFQKEPILIAINENDEEQPQSPFRTHGRVLDGKHRYFDKKKQNLSWRHQFVLVKSFEDFIKLRKIVGEHKQKDVLGRDVRGEQTRHDIVNYMNYLWEVEGINPESEVCAEAVKRIGNGHPYSVRLIHLYCPPRFKQQIKVKAANILHEKETKKKFPKDVEIDKLNTQLDNSMKRVFELEQRSLPETIKDKIINNLEREKKNLQTKIGVLRDEVKKHRKKAGIDQTNEDFETWWQTIEDSTKSVAIQSAAKKSGKKEKK